VLSIVLGVVFVIVANAALSTWLTRWGLTRVSSLRQFFALALVNAALIVLYAVLLPGRGESINLWNTLFFALLMTLIVTLFDRYRPIHTARFELDRPGEQAG
jgi:hypothetical protein